MLGIVLQKVTVNFICSFSFFFFFKANFLCLFCFVLFLCFFSFLLLTAFIVLGPLGNLSNLTLFCKDVTNKTFFLLFLFFALIFLLLLFCFVFFFLTPVGGIRSAHIVISPWLGNVCPHQRGTPLRTSSLCKLRLVSVSNIAALNLAVV